MNATVVENETDEIPLTESLESASAGLPAEEPPAVVEPAPVPQESRIIRFHVSERMLRWAIAIPFVVCAISGSR